MAKILAFASPLLISAPEGVDAQPAWVAGTPSVPTTESLSITLNYGINVTGNVYYIVYNFNNTAQLTSSYVRTNAQQGPSGTKVASGVLQVKKADTQKVLQVVINVNDPDQVHTIYVVAADSKSKLQATPVRLNATTKPCPQADAGSGGEECDLNFTFSAVSAFNSGSWSMVNGPGRASYSPNANSPAATVTVSVYGTYTFRWTESKGRCSSFDDVTVGFYHQTQSNAGNNGNECGLEHTMSATVPSAGTGTWVMTSGSGSASFLPDAGSPSAVVTVSDYGSKIFTWTVVNGSCTSTSSVTINFYEQPVADAGNGGNNCGSEFYLNAHPSIGSGLWTRVSGPGSASFSPDAGNPSAKVTVSQSGNYVFRWTETNGSCVSSETISVSFGQELSADAGNGGDECDRDFKLNAVPQGGIGTWSKITGAGNAVFTPDAHHPDALVTVTQYGDYNFAWTEVQNNCSSSDVIKVGFHSPPDLNAGPDLSVCKGNTIQLSASGSGSFQWSPANLLDNPLIYNPVAHPQNDVTFTVTLTDQWGCRNTDQIVVVVKDNPVANAGQDQVLDYVFRTLLDAGSLLDGETGEWLLIAGTGTFENKNSPVTQVSNLSIGMNKMVWTVTNGVCPLSSDTLSVTVNSLVFPSLITPNMDGKNDFFIIKGIQSMGKANLTIFNRWGLVVFSSDNYDNKWDGKDSNGNPLPEDTYFIILKSENSRPVSGFVVIRR